MKVTYYFFNIFVVHVKNGVIDIVGTNFAVSHLGHFIKYPNATVHMYPYNALSFYVLYNLFVH